MKCLRVHDNCSINDIISITIKQSLYSLTVDWFWVVTFVLARGGGHKERLLALAALVLWCQPSQPGDTQSV